MRRLMEVICLASADLRFTGHATSSTISRRPTTFREPARRRKGRHHCLEQIWPALSQGSAGPPNVQNLWATKLQTMTMPVVAISAPVGQGEPVHHQAHRRPGDDASHEDETASQRRGGCVPSKDVHPAEHVGNHAARGSRPAPPERARCETPRPARISVPWGPRRKRRRARWRKRGQRHGQTV